MAGGVAAFEFQWSPTFSGLGFNSTMLPSTSIGIVFAPLAQSAFVIGPNTARASSPNRVIELLLAVAGSQKISPFRRRTAAANDSGVKRRATEANGQSIDRLLPLPPRKHDFPAGLKHLKIARITVIRFAPRKDLDGGSGRGRRSEAASQHIAPVAPPACASTSPVQCCGRHLRSEAADLDILHPGVRKPVRAARARDRRKNTNDRDDVPYSHIAPGLPQNTRPQVEASNDWVSTRPRLCPRCVCDERQLREAPNVVVTLYESFLHDCRIVQFGNFLVWPRSVTSRVVFPMTVFSSLVCRSVLLSKCRPAFAPNH